MEEEVDKGFLLLPKKEYYYYLLFRIFAWNVNDRQIYYYARIEEKMEKKKKKKLLGSYNFRTDGL